MYPAQAPLIIARRALQAPHICIITDVSPLVPPAHSMLITPVSNVPTSVASVLQMDSAISAMSLLFFKRVAVWTLVPKATMS